MLFPLRFFVTYRDYSCLPTEIFGMDILISNLNILFTIELIIYQIMFIGTNFQVPIDLKYFP